MNNFSTIKEKKKEKKWQWNGVGIIAGINLGWIAFAANDFSLE